MVGPIPSHIASQRLNDIKIVLGAAAFKEMRNAGYSIRWKSQPIPGSLEAIFFMGMSHPEPAERRRTAAEPAGPVHYLRDAADFDRLIILIYNQDVAPAFGIGDFVDVPVAAATGQMCCHCTR